MADFVVKLPVFHLEGGHRALLLHAQTVDDTLCMAQLMYDDGRIITTGMTIARVQQATKNGPFVVLAEVRDSGAKQRTGLIDPSGNPI